MVYVLCSVLAAITLLLTIKIIVLKKSAREITEKLEEKLNTDTNTLIDLSTADRDMKRLAAKLNNQISLLRKERLRFEQGDRELKTAVTNISHDLRTPLTAINGYLDLLKREEMSKPVQDYISQIRGRTEAMNRLTEELFQYSVAAVQEPNLEKLCINYILEESIAAMYGAFKKEGVTPVINIAEKPVQRISDHSALMRIFGNLLGNAVKYSDGELFITLSENGKITFENSSKKLENVDAGRLFDRFYTVETGSKSTGLGLSIAKLLTESLGGSISAEIKENRLIISLFFPTANTDSA